MNGLIKEAHGVSLVGGTFLAEHTEELGIILTEVNLLTMCLVICLSQKAQGHGGYEDLCLLFLFAEGTEQNPARRLGPHEGGWGEAQLAEGVSTGGHCILHGSLAGKTSNSFVGGS